MRHPFVNKTTVAWISDNRFEQVSLVNGNEKVVIEITGIFSQISLFTLISIGKHRI